MVAKVVVPPVPRLAVFLSGGGTTLQNLLDRQAAGALAGVVACVASDRDGVAGLDRAAKAGVPATVARRKDHPGRESFSAALAGFAESHGADLICLAGFLQLLAVPPRWENRVINIHPSLLPSFGGKGCHGAHVHQAVLDAGCKVSGCTVHLATNEYDRGPILVQKAVPVHPDDTASTLAARVFSAECEAYPEAIALLASGRVSVEANRAIINPK
ncbi:MAG: phosphoribosylglycinamide formyltransferase [Planctomycetes bacterium]|nr:phosphoribosylglycinamide formyltransferase [Planctomycetota bacterium]